MKLSTLYQLTHTKQSLLIKKGKNIVFQKKSEMNGVVAEGKRGNNYGTKILPEKYESISR